MYKRRIKISKKIICSCGILLTAGMFLQFGMQVEATEKVKRSEVMPPPVGCETLMEMDKSEEEILSEAENFEMFGYRNLGIANVENNLNIRAGADESTFSPTITICIQADSD